MKWRAHHRVSIAIALVLLVIGHTPPVRASWNAGNFLRFGVGARPLGMGSSFVAIADDATAVYWNPAGLTQSTHTQIFLAYADRFGLGIQDQNAGIAIPWGKRVGVGFGIVRSSLTDIKYIERPSGQPRPVVTGTFEDTEYALLLASGIRVLDILSVGITAKYFGHELANKNASGIGVDIGWLFHPTEQLTIGLNAQNLNRPRISWSTSRNHYDRVPANFKLGSAYEVLPSKLRLSFDMDIPDFDAVVVNAGAEFVANQFISMRGGLTGTSLSTGGSVSLEKFRLDYAFRRHDLGDTHRFAMIFGF